MIIKTFYSKGGLDNRVEVTLFEAPNKDGIVGAHTFTTFLNDDALTKIEAMTDEELKTLVEESISEPKVRVIGANPKLDNSGKITSAKEASFVPDI